MVLTTGKSFVPNRSDIHETAKYSLPSPGGVTRLCASPEDKMARDWFHDQVMKLGAIRYFVNATGSQFAVFKGEDDSIPPIAMGSHLDSVATGGKFDGPLGVSTLKFLLLTRDQTYASLCFFLGGGGR